MLEDAGVPAFGGGELWRAMLVEIAQANASEARNLGDIAVYTETALKEIYLRAVVDFHLRIDEYVEVHGDALTRLKLRGAPGGLVLRAVFDDGQLNAESDLRGGQTDAGREAQGFQHVGDGLLQLGALNLIGGKGTGDLPEYGISGLYDLKLQGRGPSGKYFRSQRIDIRRLP
jgi:hypothetical protein